jgi:hypothetical protein
VVERAKYLVGGNVVKTKLRLPLGCQTIVVTSSRFEQNKGPDDIGLDEVRRPVDRSINVAFRREVHHGIWIMRLEYRLHCLGVGNVGLDEAILRMLILTRQRILRRRISQLIDVDHLVAGFAQQVANHGGTNEPTPARQQKLHELACPPPVVSLSAVTSNRAERQR